ncbi:MAG: hypothetical protein AAF772_15490, partial [Acidobacteriota bacterium]
MTDAIATSRRVLTVFLGALLLAAVAQARVTVETAVTTPPADDAAPAETPADAPRAATIGDRIEARIVLDWDAAARAAGHDPDALRAAAGAAVPTPTFPDWAAPG